MGLLNSVGFANGLSQAGKSLSSVGEDWGRSLLEQEKIKLADQLASAREATGDIRRAGLQEDAAKKAAERAPIVAGATRSAEINADLAAAPKKLEAAVAQAKAVKQAEFDFENDPTNVEKKSAAEASRAKFNATAAADLTGELMKRPDYLDNIKKLALAQNPAMAAQIAASAATQAKAAFELGQSKALATARTDMANAKTPEAKLAAKGKIEALEWSVSSERAQQAADSTVLVSLGKTIKDSRTIAANPMTDDVTKQRETATADSAQATYDALMKEYVEKKGLKLEAPAGAKRNGWDDTTGDVFKDGQKIGTAKSQSEAVAMLKRGAPPAAAAVGGKPATGLIETSAMASVPAASVRREEIKTRMPRLAAALEVPGVPESEKERYRNELRQLGEELAGLINAGS